MENRVRYIKNISGAPLDINGTVIQNNSLYEPSVSWWLDNYFFDWLYSTEVSIILIDGSEFNYITYDYIFSNYLTSTHNYFTENKNNILDIPIFSTRVTGGTYDDLTNTLTLHQNNDISNVVITGFTDGSNIITGYTSGNTLYLTTYDGNTIPITLPESDCPSGLTIYDEGILVKSDVCEINFVGADVWSLPGSGNRVNVYIPTPTFKSHWNTSDGTTVGTVTENNLSRTTARISTPNISEGNPFYSGTWSGTNQQATLTNSFVFTSTDIVTGFGGDSYIKVDVYVGSDVLLTSYQTPTITTGGTFNNSGSTISVAIASYATDFIRFSAKPTITVNIGSLLPNGGKVKVVCTHKTDSVTDSGSNYIYTQSYVFYDNNPSTPQINGVVDIIETTGNIVSKHISGIEYYTLNSQFTVSALNIDNLNSNTQATADNLTLTTTEYGITSITPEPFNVTYTSNFTGWTNNNNVNDVDFSINNLPITQTSYRFRDTTANISARPKDQWNNGTLVNSSNKSILIDTFTDNSTDLNETFLGESKRFTDSGFTTSWDSTTTLSGGQALVMGGYMMIPSSGTKYNGTSDTGTNGNWSTYKSDLNGANPDYTTLSGSSSFFRKYLSGNASDLNNFTITFTGTFVGGNALSDLQNNRFQMFIRKIDSSSGSALTGTTAPANILHGATGYNSGTYDQGVLDGQIRLGTSSGNTIRGTFGSWPCKTGFYCEIKILNSSVKISGISVAFNI